MIEPGSLVLIRRSATAMRDEERGTLVECKDRIEILNLHVGEISWTVPAGVVDEDLKRRCFGGYGAARRFDVGHVEHQTRLSASILKRMPAMNVCEICQIDLAK